MFCEEDRLVQFKEMLAEEAGARQQWIGSRYDKDSLGRGGGGAMHLKGVLYAIKKSGIGFVLEA